MKFYAPEYEQEPRNVTETGLTLLQINPDLAAMLNPESQYYGWLFWHHPDGQWVTKRKLSADEISEANDQAADMMVLNAAMRSSTE